MTDPDDNKSFFRGIGAEWRSRNRHIMVKQLWNVVELLLGKIGIKFSHGHMLRIINHHF